MPKALGYIYQRFFDRMSRTVLLAELIGVVLMAAATARFAPASGAFSIVLFALLWAQYAFIRLCASRRWYEDAPRYAGIERHFKKAMVPTSYIMAVCGLMFTFAFSMALLVIVDALFVVIVHVNIIFIYLHLHDHDITPPNFYTSRAPS
jgi:hypothetical protein